MVFTRREWFLAHILVTWKRQVGPKVRLAYETTDEGIRALELYELRGKFQAWVTAIDEMLREQPPNGWLEQDIP